MKNSKKEKKQPRFDSFGEEYGEDEKKGGCGKALGVVLKTVVFIVVAMIFVLLGFRNCEKRTPDALTFLLWNSEAIDAYADAGEPLTVSDVKVPMNYTTDGYFYVNNVMYVPGTRQWQITVSYNNSTLRYLESEYASEDTSDTPPVTGEYADGYGVYRSEAFVYALLDSDGNIYDTYDYISASSTLHSFRRLVFNDVPPMEEGKTLSLVIYRAKDVESARAGGEGALAWREISVYNESTSFKAHKIKSNEAYTGAPTEGLSRVTGSLRDALPEKE